jgi:hypothetical protein
MGSFGLAEKRWLGPLVHATTNNEMSGTWACQFGVRCRMQRRRSRKRADAAALQMRASDVLLQRAERVAFFIKLVITVRHVTILLLGDALDLRGTKQNMAVCGSFSRPVRPAL